MAYSFDPAVVQRILAGLGTALSAAGSGNPNWGLAGGQAIADTQRQQQADATGRLQMQIQQETLQRQRQADEDQRKKEAAARAWLIGQKAPASAAAAYEPNGGLSGKPGAIGSLPQGMQGFLTGYADVDPLGAMQMAGAELTKEPDKSAPVVKDFYEGGNVVQKQWDPSTKSWSVVGSGARWQPPQPPQLPSDVQEYLFAKKQDPSIGSYAQWKKLQGGNDMRYGLNPVYGVKDGKTVILLPNNQGGVIEAPLPEGVSIAPQTQFLDTGTGFVPMDKRNPQAPVAPTVGQDVAGAASAKAQGTAQGEAAAALPSYANSAELALQNVDQLLSPEAAAGRKQATGLSTWFDPRNYVPGQPGYDFKVNLDKLRGGVFLQAYQQLRGGGAITEVEGKKAEQAIAAMDAAQSEAQFQTALAEYKKVIQRGLEVARQKATATPIPPGGSPSAAAPALAPDLYSKYGLTPPGTNQ